MDGVDGRLGGDGGLDGAGIVLAIGGSGGRSARGTVGTRAGVAVVFFIILTLNLRVEIISATARCGSPESTAYLGAVRSGLGLDERRVESITLHIASDVRKVSIGASGQLSRETALYIKSDHELRQEDKTDLDALPRALDHIDRASNESACRRDVLRLVNTR